LLFRVATLNMEKIGGECGNLDALEYNPFHSYISQLGDNTGI
jgi:hypothetical protein